MRVVEFYRELINKAKSEEELTKAFDNLNIERLTFNTLELDYVYYLLFHNKLDSSIKVHQLTEYSYSVTNKENICIELYPPMFDEAMFDRVIIGLILNEHVEVLINSFDDSNVDYKLVYKLIELRCSNEYKEKVKELFKKNSIDYISNYSIDYIKGYMKYYKIGEEYNLKEAINHFTIASSQDFDSNPFACYELGKIYYQNQLDEKDPNIISDNKLKGVDLLKKAINNKEKALMLGDFYFFGEEITPDYQMAFNYYNSLKGNNELESRLGLCYLFGLGTDKSITEAVELLKKNKNNYSDFALGYYEYNYLKNYDKAYKLFESNNFYMNYFMLGQMYFYGHGCSKNYNFAKQYFIDFLKEVPIDKSILLFVNPGYSSVLNSKTYTNEIPSLVNKTKETALYLSKIYAEEGSYLLANVCKAVSDKKLDDKELVSKAEIESIFQLGVECDNKNDNSGSSKWYNLAAQLGHAEAQYRVALLHSMYSFGDIDVKYWLNKAAAQGHKESIKYLNKE